VRTKDWRSNTPGLRLVGEEESGYVSENFGPLKAGLTTSQVTNKDQALSELLNSLERRVEILEYKYSEVLGMYLNVMSDLVRLLPTIKDVTIIDLEGDNV